MSDNRHLLIVGEQDEALAEAKRRGCENGAWTSVRRPQDVYTLPRGSYARVLVGDAAKNGITAGMWTALDVVKAEPLVDTATPESGPNFAAWLDEQIAVCDAWAAVGDRDIPERGERYWRGQADAFREVRDRVGGAS